MENTSEIKLSPLAAKILFSFVAFFFIALSSILMYQAGSVALIALQHKAETKGVILSKEDNSVSQHMIYAVEYTWERQAHTIENLSALPDHLTGDTLTVILNPTKPSEAVLKEDKWLQGALFTLLIWGFSIVFGIFLIKKAFKVHE